MENLKNNYEAMKNYLIEKGVKFDGNLVDVDTYYDIIVIPAMNNTKQFIQQAAEEFGQGEIDAEIANIQSYVFQGIISQEEAEADNALEIIEKRLKTILENKTVEDIYPTLVNEEELTEIFKYYETCGI